MSQVSVGQATQLLTIVARSRIEREACLSYDTTLDAGGITDINSDYIHVSIARHGRLRRAGGERYVIYYEDSAPQQVTWSCPGSSPGGSFSEGQR